jgi:hypothetical protein
MLACRGLDMNWAEQVDPHHRGDAACIIANAFVCRVSMQTTGKPASANPLNRLCDKGPASSPIRTSRKAGSWSAMCAGTHPAPRTRT